MKKRTGSTLGGLAVVASLCALPAHGQDTSLSTQILYALTPIDRSPTREELSILGDPAQALAELRKYATGASYDFGMQLRAIRAIPHFCPGALTACRDALLAVFASIDAPPPPPPAPQESEPPGQKILRRRAAIEALGAARAGHSQDVPLLTGFLGDGSRDVRVAAARALRDLCDPAAIPALGARRAIESVEQVRRALDEALVVLAECGP